ncbi:MAG: hypothetical protein KDM63_09140, partial [Verrucomicrobiae bacterium]|nr:hypothetical protein [Verrucomicrobiae bacterium]
KAGPTPSDYFVVDGEWSIADLDGGKVLKLTEEPLVDGQLQLGESLKETGGSIVAKVKAEKKRRSFPRFGVGLHGMSGFRLRLVPVQNKIELVRNEEVVASADLTWQSGQWWFLELSVTRANEGWSVAGRAWPDGGSRPEQATIETTSTEPKFSGKASVSGTPFAGLPIFFDEIVIRKEVAGVNQSAP